MTPIFKCLICRKDIERSTKTFWVKKGHLLCSTCLDNIDKKKSWVIKLEIDMISCSSFLNKPRDVELKETYFVIIHIKKLLQVLLHIFSCWRINFEKLLEWINER